MCAKALNSNPIPTFQTKASAISIQKRRLVAGLCANIRLMLLLRHKPDKTVLAAWPIFANPQCTTRPVPTKIKQVYYSVRTVFTWPHKPHWTIQ